MDKRLCDKGELIVAFNTSEYGKPERAEERTFPNKLAVQIVEDMPEVDAVEVVRCKDCKYASEFEGCEDYVEQVRCCTQHEDCDMLPKVWPNDFCSYGERRDDDGR